MNLWRLSMMHQLLLERKKNVAQKTDEIKRHFYGFFQNFFYGPLAVLKDFEPKIEFCLDKGDFVVKTAQNTQEVLQALKLRHDVFYEELLLEKKSGLIDIDRFDCICDHLMVLEKKTGDLIGTYRFNSSLFSDEFYSATEFDLSNIFKLKGSKLELGRACIRQDQRNGITISLLWAGIAEYVKATRADYLFGCSSIKTTNMHQIFDIYHFVQENYFSPDDTRVQPVGKYKIKKLHLAGFNQTNPAINYDAKNARKMLPSLLRSYLKAGAVVCGEPALDKDFKCIDLFTLMNVAQIENAFSRKFEL